MKKTFIAVTIFLFLTGCGMSVIPEMKEFMDTFGSPDKVSAFVEKHSGGPDIVPEALKTCNLGKPSITATGKNDGMVVYTVEAVVEKCEKSETAVGTIRVFDIGWQDGKIVKFEWKGPKSGKVEY